MSRMTRNDADTAESMVRDRARQAAAQVQQAAAQVQPVADRVKPMVADWVKPMAAQVKPAARTAGAAAGRGLLRTRAWAAPQIEHTGQVLQDSVAPKVSALLSSAAQRVEPAKPRSRRWPKLVAISLLIAAAASAAAAVVRGRRRPDYMTGAVEPDAGQPTPAAQMRDGQLSTSTEADADGRPETGADANGQLDTSAEADGQVRTT